MPPRQTADGDWRLHAPGAGPYLFGDLLALARRSWVRQMADGLERAGFPDYRRSDAAIVRLLARGGLTVGRLGELIGVTRQAARKLADGLERRGYARTERDELDARKLLLSLTPQGVAYARAIVVTIDALGRELAERVAPEQLEAAEAVLRAAIVDPGDRRRVDRLVKPPAAAADPIQRDRA
ncbi:MAG: MarR family winged helix-turn-helix transcriptional regulator [Solirubrobacteraceae bacterium]